MNFYIKKQDFSFSKILIKIGAIAVLIVFLNMFRAPVKNYFNDVFSPIGIFLTQTGVNLSGFWRPFSFGDDIQKENNNLRTENQKLLLRIAEMKDSSKEANSIAEMGKFSESEKFKTMFARIIGADANNDFMIINKGEENGLKENMPVISEKKILYGKVIEVHENFSKILLISAKNSVVNIKTEGENIDKSIYGVARGEGNLSIRLDLVETDSEIKEGDTLITSALERIFPSNLLVGKIKTVNKNDQQPFQTAELERFFDITNTDSIFVITNYLN